MLGGTTPFLLCIYQGNTNTHGKIGGQKVVTSASVYVRMGRFTSVFIVFSRSQYNTQNLIPVAMCQFRDRFWTKIRKSTVNVVFSGYMGFQQMLRFCRYVFSCTSNLHVFYRANRVLRTWIEGPFCVETSEL